MNKKTLAKYQKKDHNNYRKLKLKKKGEKNDKVFYIKR